MAGAGYKLFNTGDVLTAAQVNTYLQEQVVMVFANAAARTTALSGVLAEGMVTYLKDTDALEIYSGAAWVGYGSGDITGITTGATSGLSGGVTSGTADLKLNTTAKGGLLVGTGSGTVTELAVGSNDQVLTADSSTASGLKWAASGSTSGPAFRAFRNTSQQSFNQNTWTKIQFNGETFDTDNCFDSSTNYRFTPNKAGYYQINLAATWSGANASTTKALAIYKNGSTNSKCFDSSGSGTPGAGAAANGGDLIYFNGSSDYVEGYIYDSDASARNVVNGSEATYFSGVWIRS